MAEPTETVHRTVRAKLLESWRAVTGTIVGTAAAISVIYASVMWFQPAAEADLEHAAIRTELAQYAATSESDHHRDALEAELERIELAIKLYHDRAERRQLTADEQEELEYLKTRRRQIRERLYDQ